MYTAASAYHKLHRHTESVTQEKSAMAMMCNINVLQPKDGEKQLTITVTFFLLQNGSIWHLYDPCLLCASQM